MPPRKKRLFRPSVPECGAEPEDHEPPAGAQTGRPQFDEVFSVIPEALPLVWHNICATPLAPEARRLTLDYDMIQVMTRLLDHFCCHPEGSMTITLTLRREWQKVMERLFAHHTAESILAVFKYPGQRSKASRDCFAPSHARGEDPGMNVKYALALMLLVPVSEVRSLHTDMEELTNNFNNLSLSSRSLHTQLAPRQRYMRATRAAFALSSQGWTHESSIYVTLCKLTAYTRFHEIMDAAAKYRRELLEELCRPGIDRPGAGHQQPSPVILGVLTGYEYEYSASDSEEESD
jgi:hypothetical protein